MKEKLKASNVGKRLAETLTSEQKAIIADARKAVLKERPELIAQAKIAAEATAAVDVEIRHAFELLKALRVMQKVSLNELAERTGIAKSNLSALENNPAPNVTLLTLVRYAKALGKELRISLGDAPANPRRVAPRRRRVVTA